MPQNQFISSAIATHGPSTAAACNEDTKTNIPNIAYVEDEYFETERGFLVQIGSSSYNDSSTLNALIEMAAQSFAVSAIGG